MSASGKWYLNTLDTYDTYGLAVMEGNAGFLAYPKRKTSLSHNWAEENGIDIDLDEPRFEAKEVRLRCVFIAPDEAAYWIARDNFFAALNQPGWQTWRIADHGKDYSVYYKEASNFILKTKRLKTELETICTFDLVLVVADALQENTPGSGAPVTILQLDGTVVTSVVAGGSYTIPSISAVDGGDSTGDAQFSPINGLLDGN